MLVQLHRLRVSVRKTPLDANTLPGFAIETAQPIGTGRPECAVRVLRQLYDRALAHPLRFVEMGEAAILQQARASVNVADPKTAGFQRQEHGDGPRSSWTQTVDGDALEANAIEAMQAIRAAEPEPAVGGLCKR